MLDPGAELAQIHHLQVWFFGIFQALNLKLDSRRDEGIVWDEFELCMEDWSLRIRHGVYIYWRTTVRENGKKPIVTSNSYSVPPHFRKSSLLFNVLVIGCLKFQSSLLLLAIFYLVEVRIPAKETCVWVGRNQMPSPGLIHCFLGGILYAMIRRDFECFWSWWLETCLSSASQGYWVKRSGK